MRDYSMSSQIKVTSSCEEANQLLGDYWSLLDLFHNADGTLLFVPGGQCPLNPDVYSGVLMDSSGVIMNLP